jgi:streptogramin lyase
MKHHSRGICRGFAAVAALACVLAMPPPVHASVRHVQLVKIRSAAEALLPGVSYIGTVTTIANFSNQGLNAIVYDSDDGRYYITLYGNLYRIEANGQTTLIANFNNYGFPDALLWDAHAHLFYVSCPQNYQVVSVTATGTITLLAGGTHGTNDGTGSSAQFQYPSGMALDPQHHLLYVADNDRMRTITEKGNVVTVGATGMLDPNYSGQGYNLAYDTRAHVVAIADVPSDSIIGFNALTTAYHTIGGRCLLVNNQSGCSALYAEGTRDTALFANPQGISYDPASDAFYVADSSNFMLRKVTANGITTRIAGSGQSALTDGVYLAASFLGPSCASFDPVTGNVLVCDNGYVRGVSTKGRTPPPPPHTFAMRLLPSLLSAPTGMVSTTDGSLWFAENTSAAVGRVLPDRTVREYALPGGYAQPYDVALAADGNVVFGNFKQISPPHGDIGEITVAGKITEIAFPNRCSYGPSYPTLLSAAPSGDLWFAGVCPTSIGFETPQHAFTEYVSSALGGLTAAAGSVIWAGDQYNVYQYSSSGVLLKNYPVAADGGVTVAPNGDVWVLGTTNQTVADLIPTTGNIKTYQLPPCGSGCFRTLGNPIWGRDGALWFTESGGRFQSFPGAIGRITTKGAFTEFPSYKPRSQPSGVSFDSRGTAWMADSGANKIGRMQ